MKKEAAFSRDEIKTFHGGANTNQGAIHKGIRAELHSRNLLRTKFPPTRIPLRTFVYQPSMGVSLQTSVNIELGEHLWSSNAVVVTTGIDITRIHCVLGGTI